MRATTFVFFLRFIGAGGVGAYLGAAAAGVLAVLTGGVFTPGSPWVTAVPMLAILGAVAGCAIARLTRHWLVPQLDRRLLWSTLAGAVALPLATAVAHLGTLLNVGLLLILAGSVTTAVVWQRWIRNAYPTTRAHHSRRAIARH